MVIGWIAALNSSGHSEVMMRHSQSLGLIVQVKLTQAMALHAGPYVRSIWQSMMITLLRQGSPNMIAPIARIPNSRTI